MPRYRIHSHSASHFHSVSFCCNECYFLLDQKVAKKSSRPDYRGFAIGTKPFGKNFSWTALRKGLASLGNASTFRMLLTNRNFSDPHFRGATIFPPATQWFNQRSITNVFILILILIFILILALLLYSFAIFCLIKKYPKNQVSLYRPPLLSFSSKK
jgi:hypothetical protein